MTLDRIRAKLFNLRFALETQYLSHPGVRRRTGAAIWRILVE
jgi:hypothetical protein